MYERQLIQRTNNETRNLLYVNYLLIKSERLGGGDIAHASPRDNATLLQRLYNLRRPPSPRRRREGRDQSPPAADRFADDQVGHVPGHPTHT